MISGEVGTRRGSYNTRLLDPNEIRSWCDLLKPDLKGKLGTFDPRVAGGGESFAFFYDAPSLGPQFIQRLLTETDMLITRNLEQGADWLSNSYKDIRQALETAAARQIPLPLTGMVNEIQEMGRARGLSRLNTPAAMGRLYEILTATDLGNAVLEGERVFPEAHENEVIDLEETEKS